MATPGYLPSSLVTSSTADAAFIPSAGWCDTLAVLGEVVAPTLAKGVIMRRQSMVALAEHLDLDRRAIRRMQRVRNKYGPGPLLLRIPGRALALILHPGDVHRVLMQSPEPFATASAEKRAALAHFEPKNVLISHGRDRADRRVYNEEILDAHRPVHQMAESFLRVVDEEAACLRNQISIRGQLRWNEFSDVWFRIVRRVIFGKIARDDDEPSVMMAKLRLAANWAFLYPKRTQLREHFLKRIRSYLSRAEPDSLAGLMARITGPSNIAPEQQIPQWLFAFDPAGMTTFRSLALLASHAEYLDRARKEIGDHSRADMPFLRATVLESLRLWPTTPLVLRESTAETIWPTGVMPKNTGVVIFTPFFHRDHDRLPYADRFSPELWMQGQTTQEDWPLIPFSEGPAICPGRYLVLLLSTAMLVALLQDGQIQLKSPARLRAGQPLPATLNHYSLQFLIKR